MWVADLAGDGAATPADRGHRRRDLLQLRVRHGDRRAAGCTGWPSRRTSAEATRAALGAADRRRGHRAHRGRAVGAVRAGRGWSAPAAARPGRCRCATWCNGRTDRGRRQRDRAGDLRPGLVPGAGPRQRRPDPHRPDAAGRRRPAAGSPAAAASAALIDVAVLDRFEVLGQTGAQGPESSNQQLFAVRRAGPARPSWSPRASAWCSTAPASCGGRPGWTTETRLARARSADARRSGHRPKGSGRRSSSSCSVCWIVSRTWSARLKTTIGSSASSMRCAGRDRRAELDQPLARQRHQPSGPSHGNVGVTGKYGSPSSRASGLMSASIG